MLYRTIDISPSSIRASLRAMSRGQKPKILPSLLATLLLECQMREHAPSDDFVRFANRLYSLDDARGSL